MIAMEGNDIKEQLRAKSREMGFQLFGVSDIRTLEDTPYPDGRGLVRPSEVMPGAKSVMIMGMVIWEEGMNVSVSTAGTGDFSGGENEYYNLYYEMTETRAWRFSKWISDTYHVEAIPSNAVHLKVGAMLAGLGWIGHNTLVITPEYGPRVRWVAIVSDLDLEPDAPFARNLCEESAECREAALCEKACPYRAIVPGPSQGVEPGKKLTYDKCVVAHEFDADLEGRWEKYVRRVGERAFMECTICNIACPYGRRVEIEIAPAKRGKS